MPPTPQYFCHKAMFDCCSTREMTFSYSGFVFAPDHIRTYRYHAECSSLLCMYRCSTLGACVRPSVSRRRVLVHGVVCVDWFHLRRSRPSSSMRLRANCVCVERNCVCVDSPHSDSLRRDMNSVCTSVRELGAVGVGSQHGVQPSFWSTVLMWSARLGNQYG